MVRAALEIGGVIGLQSVAPETEGEGELSRVEGGGGGQGAPKRTLSRCCGTANAPASGGDTVIASPKASVGERGEGNRPSETPRGVIILYSTRHGPSPPSSSPPPLPLRFSFLLPAPGSHRRETQRPSLSYCSRGRPRPRLHQAKAAPSACPGLGGQCSPSLGLGNHFAGTKMQKYTG